MQETPAAAQAFEDMWALGDSRSISKLAAEYRRRSDGGEGVPTTRERTLEEWSSQHNWQDRIKARIAEDAEKLRERADKQRERLATLLETEFGRAVRDSANDPNKRLADNAADLERLAKLYYQLVGQPLADRHEVSGPGGGPVEVSWFDAVREACAEEGD
jgi:hypothetical protein